MLINRLVIDANASSKFVDEMKRLEMQTLAEIEPIEEASTTGESRLQRRARERAEKKAAGRMLDGRAWDEVPA